MNAEGKNPANRGSLVAFAAFFAWGLLPLYWKGLASVNSVEVLCHRMCWSFFTMIPVMTLTGRMTEAARAFKDGKTFIILVCSSVTLAFNWGVYIWAVNADHVLDASFGYFITPLLNMLLGVCVFKERPSALAWVAITLAAIGVGYQIAAFNRFPWVALAVGGSFSLYSLFRKVVMVEALPGLFVETVIFFPFAAGVIVYFALQGESAFFRGEIGIDLLLVGSGIITTAPLVAFAYGARNLPMTTLGLLQYVTPSMAFLIGIFLFREPLTASGLVTFALIWTALGLYTWDNLRKSKRARAMA